MKKPKINWAIGSRYTYSNKNTCYNVSLMAIADGCKVRYGISDLGSYYFEIIDPWEKDGEQE